MLVTKLTSLFCRAHTQQANLSAWTAQIKSHLPRRSASTGIEDEIKAAVQRAFALGNTSADPVLIVACAPMVFMIAQPLIVNVNHHRVARSYPQSPSQRQRTHRPSSNDCEPGKTEAAEKRCAAGDNIRQWLGQNRS